MATTRHTDAASALAQVRRIYDNGLAHLRKAMQRYVAGEFCRGKAGLLPVRAGADPHRGAASATDSARLSLRLCGRSRAASRPH
jgi:hypothetical protein